MITNDDMFKAYNVYRRCVESADGVCRYAYQPHIRHWSSIAGLAAEMNTDVERLICAKFAMTPPKIRCSLVPKNIYHPKYLAQQALEAYDPDSHLDWPNIWSDMSRRLVQASTRFRCGINAILADPAMPYQAWFRVIAMDPADETVYRRFGTVALKEADTDLELKNFLKEKLNGRYIERFEGRLQQVVPAQPGNTPR